MKMSDHISVIEFLGETKDDINSPTTSTFTSKMSLCRATIAALEDSLDADRSALKKMKNATKALHGSGQTHVSNEMAFTSNLEKLGNAAMAKDSEIGSSFLKFTVFTKEVTSLLKNLISNINNALTFPLESLLKGDLKGIKGDMKRPFDKSWKDYDTKVKQVEREKRQLAKEAGMIRTEITGAEIAEEMEKERRMFQLQVCEYLIKANEIKTKKGVELLQHLIEFYHAQSTFFSEGLKVIEQYQAYTEGLTANLHSLRQSQDEEHRQLMDLRNMLKSSISADSDSSSHNTKNQNVYNLHQIQGNKELGNEKSGYLLKKSEGLRKAWQKRKCVVEGGFLTMSHNNMSKPPVKLNLLTSQLKLVGEDKRQFDLVSHNRTYRFMADDENAAMAWVSVLSNSKEDALNQVFGIASSGKNGSEENAGLRELTGAIIVEVRNLPGNDLCCDCNAQNPTWLSTNLGVLLCIECSGIHREMGVHVSRIQSITLDDLGTSELILARSVGNENFNDIMEVKLEPHDKPTPSSDMDERKSFIRGKYISHNYVMRTCGNDRETLADELQLAINSCEISSLLQLFAEGAELTEPLPGYANGESAIHVAVSLPYNEAQPSVLPLVDFLTQNLGQGLNRKTLTGNTALHICAELNRTECMKLLLRSKANTNIENTDGETALMVAKRMGHAACVELLEQAISGKFTPIVHIDIEWNLTFFDEDDFGSDDDLDDRPIPTIHYTGAAPSPAKSHSDMPRNRPTSFKERNRAFVDPGNQTPTPPPRVSPSNPPAIPPHQGALSRSRSSTVQPMSSLAEHASSRRLSNHPPPLPIKPDLPSKTFQRGQANIQNSTHNTPNPKSEQKRDHAPEFPPKNSVLKHFGSFGAKRRNPRRRDTPVYPPASPLSRNNPYPTPEPRSKTLSWKPTNSNNNRIKTTPKRAKPYSQTSARNQNKDGFPKSEVELVTARRALRHQTARLSLSNDAQRQQTSPMARCASAAFPATLPNNDVTTARRKSGGYPALKPKPLLKSHSSDEILHTSDDCSPRKSLSGSDSYDNLSVFQLPISTPKPHPTPTRSPRLPPTPQTHFPSHVDPDRPTSLISSSQHHQHAAFGSSPRVAIGGTLKPGVKLTNVDIVDRTRSLPRGGAPPTGSPETPPPVPLPRAGAVPPSASKPKRVRAIYDCEADNGDELTFVENEIIIVTGVEDQDWWVGHVEHQPHRTGVFPVSFVHILSE